MAAFLCELLLGKIILKESYYAGVQGTATFDLRQKTEYFPEALYIRMYFSDCRPLTAGL